MPRYTLRQSQPKSCGGACSAVLLAELGVSAPATVTTATEMNIYGQIQRNAGGESAPALVANYLQARGLRVWLMENPARTALLMAGSRGALVLPWLQNGYELWRHWAWRYWRGLLASDFDDDARVMLVVIIADGTNRTHYLLARRDAGNYWVMNPDGGVDVQDNNLFTFVSTTGGVRMYGAVPYIYTGIALWISPPNGRWWFRF